MTIAERQCRGTRGLFTIGGLLAALLVAAAGCDVPPEDESSQEQTDEALRGQPCEGLPPKCPVVFPKPPTPPQPMPNPNPGPSPQPTPMKPPEQPKPMNCYQKCTLKKWACEAKAQREKQDDAHCSDEAQRCDEKCRKDPPLN